MNPETQQQALARERQLREFDPSGAVLPQVSQEQARTSADDIAAKLLEEWV